MGVRFITLRRRSRKPLHEIQSEPLSAWRRIELENIPHACRTPCILKRKIALAGYDGPIRQLTVTDLGRDESTLLLTNHLHGSPAELIGRYAQRMIMENSIEEGIGFFHMDALSSTVAMKINCDVQLTVMASSLYRLLGQRVGNGYETAKSRHIFRDLVNGAAQVTIERDSIMVRLYRRAHNPLLIAADFGLTDVAIPWLGGKRLNIQFI